MLTDAGGHQGIVVSVPHSGTRSLRQHLAFRTQYYHFGKSAAFLKIASHVHIPIRHPIDVARSWGRREKTGDVEAAYLSAYKHMFEWLPKNERRVTIHKAEDIPRLAGLNEYPDAPTESPKINRFLALANEQVIGPNMEFFEGFYPRETLLGG